MFFAESARPAPGPKPPGGRLGLRSAVDLSESGRRGQLPPVFALAAGLPGAAFESEITLTTKGGRATRCLLLEATRALPIVTKRGIPPAEPDFHRPGLGSLAPRVALEGGAGFSRQKGHFAKYESRPRS